MATDITYAAAPANEHGEVTDEYRAFPSEAAAVGALGAFPFGGLVRRTVRAWHVSWDSCVSAECDEDLPLDATPDDVVAAVEAAIARDRAAGVLAEEDAGDMPVGAWIEETTDYDYGGGYARDEAAAVNRVQVMAVIEYDEA